MKYCPNCSAELSEEPVPSSCWNCPAVFGYGAAWQLTDKPMGNFRKFTPTEPKMVSEVESVLISADPIDPLTEMFQRLAIGGVVWVIFLFLSFMLAFLGGGGGPFILLWVMTFVLSIWVSQPLGRLFKKRSPFVVMSLRLFFCGIFWVILGFLDAMNTLPFGGREPLYQLLWVISICVLPVWAFLPLRRLSERKVARGD